MTLKNGQTIALPSYFSDTAQAVETLGGNGATRQYADTLLALAQ